MRTKEITFEMFRNSMVRMTKAMYEKLYECSDMIGEVVLVYYGYYITDNLDGTYHVCFENTSHTGTLPECEKILWEGYARMELNSPAVYLDKRIEEALEQADNAFWSVIADRFPECKTGDLDPSSVKVYRDVMRMTIALWYDKNSQVKR